MCENLHYEFVYFKELHNEQEYCWPKIYRTWAALVSTITSSRAMSALTFLLFKLNTLHKAGKTVDNTQNVRKSTSTGLNGKFKIRNLTFQNRYSPTSCFPVTLSQPKPWCNYSNDSGVLNLHHSWPQLLHHDNASRWFFVIAQYHVVQISQSENRNSYSQWTLNNKSF